MNVVIIQYNAGNIRSVDFALRRLGIQPLLTQDHGLIKSADRVIFPGVGEASTTMQYLREKKLDILIRNLKQPVLGICLGLQLMCSHSGEGDTGCIGIFREKVIKFDPVLKVPHMGWNSLDNIRGRLLPSELQGEFAYFVHSYYAPVGEDTSAVSEYIVPFSAALEKDNFFATQFHPEKSCAVGEKILKRFLEL